MSEARITECHESGELAPALELNQGSAISPSYQSCAICGEPLVPLAPMAQLASSYGLALCRICQCGSGG